MLAALDSNILIYVEGRSDDWRSGAAQDLLNKMEPNQIIIPCQSIAETIRWLLKRARLEPAVVMKSANDWLETFRSQETNSNVISKAMELVEHHHLQVFDAIILSAAAEANADILLTEDMQHGFRWRGVTVINPFLPDPHPLLKKLFSN
jgi:predicted nucleic acid-binding protein